MRFFWEEAIRSCVPAAFRKCLHAQFHPEAIENGMPSVAECGGFMYLHESMTDEEGENWPWQVS